MLVQYLEWISEEELFGARMAVIVLIITVVKIAIQLTVVRALSLFGQSPKSRLGLIDSLESISSWVRLVGVALDALIEEIVFRAPLLIFVHNSHQLIVAVIVLSLLFGYMHGGWKNILVQGFGGLLYSTIFLKCGGMHQKPFEALMVVTAMHTLHNLICYEVVLGIRRYNSRQSCE